MPDKQVRAELSISHMTQYRWDHSPEMAELGWPPIIKFGRQGRKYRSRLLLETFKKILVQRAIAERSAE